MRRRMSRRSNVAHTAGYFAALLHEPGSVGDRRQVLPSCSNCALLEWVGQRRTLDLAFETAAGPVVPLGIDEYELSPRKRQRARLRHQAADMVQMTVRDHDQKVGMTGASGTWRLEPGHGEEPRQ